MASSSEKLKDKDFQNWLKVALGVSIARKGIEPYVSSVIEKDHSDALKDILSVEELDKNAVICTCDTTIFKKGSKCPRNICNKFKDKILIKHYHKNPSWKNTCVENWYRCPWEIAKCYMPPDGYRSVKSASETDMNGILSVMMNHVEFLTNRDICEEARDVTKKVRHSSDLSMSDQMLNDYLDVLINFLETYKEKHQSAVDALENLKKLKEEKLQISTDDIIDVLKANVVEEIKRERNECLQNIIKEIHLLHSVKSESLDKIFNAKLKEVLTSIDEAKASTIDEIRRKSDSFKESPHITNYETLKHELKEDVLIFNKAHYSTIPLSPLFEKEDTPFKEMYVSPEMKIVEYPLRESLRADIKTNVTCLSDILKNKIDNIYVTSKAGLGKTIFCKRLVIAWYHAHKRETFKDSFETVEDLNLLKTFDYTFLVLLREARATDCDIDTMIFDQIISHLGRSGRYTLDFLQDILTKERCLIILDGLDEWTHPKQKKCKTQNDIPHRNARENCTILTTTRTWKFCLLSLSINEIDRLVQITGLDDNASEQLVNNTVSNFSSDDVKCKNIQDFQHQLQKESLTKLKNVPLILIHLICLWYKNNTIGNSFCEIFCNIIGLHLQRAKHKLHLDECSDPKTTKDILPECISKNTHCKSSQELLMSLAKLAFNSYFDQNRENSLVFDVNMAKQYLHQDFDFCMATGLLTQTKKTRTKSVDLIEGLAPRISFAHKTFQEYFAALYMYIDDGVDIKVRTVINICSTVEDILAVTNFFIFLSGMCPDKSNLLFPALCRIIRNSETVKDYRSDMGSWNYFVGYSETIKRLQTLFVNCMIESRDNGHTPEIVNFEDLIIDSDFRSEDYSTVLKLIMKHNTRNIKSVKLREVRTQNDFKEIVQLLRTNDRNDRLSLEKLDLKCEISDESLELVLKDSEHSLKCFILKGGQWLGNIWSDKNVSLSNRNLQFIWSMNQLEELYLRTMEMTHGQLENLLAFVSESYNMKHIGLGFIKCKKHNESCNDLTLNLANHLKLRMLEIGSVPLSKIRVNTQMLEVCYVGSFSKSIVLFELLYFLSHAPKLHVFVCGFLKNQNDIKKMLETIGKLKMLQRSWLVNMEIGNNEFQLCNGMKKIKELLLMNIQMSSETFHKLVEAVKAIRKTVIVGLFDCTVDPREDFESEKQRIKSTHTIYVIQDEVKDKQQKEFIFKTLVD